MAFRFQWPYFSQEFINEAKTMLTNALNKGNKPALIVDHITVKELDMGTVPPDLEILEIGEVSMERFRGIFKLTYNGDAHIVLQTKVQANPMNVKKSDNLSYTRRGILAADQPLVVPMLLRISDFKLRGIIVLVVDQIKGITLVFKNDPLESVLVSSTFDSITPIQRFLQSEIEKQLRNLFQEDLPTAIHNLSHQFTKKPEDTASRATGTPVGLGVPTSSTYATPVASRHPSRRSSRIPGLREGTSSEPDMTQGVEIHYGEDNIFDGTDRPSPRRGSATTRSESPTGDKGHRRRGRDPHTNYPRAPVSEPFEDEKHSEEEDFGIHHRYGQGHEHGHGQGQGQGQGQGRGLEHGHDARTPHHQDLTDTKEKPIRLADSAHLASQFANLIHSNQTISPFAQNLEHFAFRSVPPKRPESVQYYSREALLSHTPSIASAPPDMGGTNGGPGNHGQSAQSRLLAAKMAAAQNQLTDRPSFGLSPGSPRISHKRMEGRIGIRRYGMQLGGPGAPRELSDHEDEYSDAEEALSETEYVHVELPNTDDEEIGEAEEEHSFSSEEEEVEDGRFYQPALRSKDHLHATLSSTTGGDTRTSTSEQPNNPSLSYPYPEESSFNMPGAFVTAPVYSSSSTRSSDRGSKETSQSNLDRRRSHHHHSLNGTSSTKSRSSLSPSHTEDEDDLHHDVAARRLNGTRVTGPPATQLSSSPPPLSPMALQQQRQKQQQQQQQQSQHQSQHRLPPSFLSSSSLPSPSSVVSRSTLAHHFAQRNPNHHQRYSQPSPRVPPPTALKRDKRNSSILSARRVSSAGIGLGVLSRESSKEKLGGGGGGRTPLPSNSSKLSMHATAID
ncbi:ERMES complex subunit [Actinomortierella ambigua]|nr:ERMES complex subunit [Actinomortierella ambigua]